MKLDFTPIVRKGFEKIASRTDKWASDSDEIQREVLRSLLSRAKATEFGRRHDFEDLSRSAHPYSRFASTVAPVVYEDLRADVMRMIRGERDVLWRGICRDFAQSSGTSGGKSKYIPVTAESLKGNHYPGGADCVAHYLRQVKDSRLFAGKGFILGGSFSNTLDLPTTGSVHVGDLSATLINRINPLANFVRIPDKKTALLSDWEVKLPALVEKAKDEDVTNISGVPSWFLTVLRRIMEAKGVETIQEVWPNLEVFFHGGISFEPYRDEYRRITDSSRMHFLETYNASEGFFAVQNDMEEGSMLLIIDKDVFYEFMPVEGYDRQPRPIWEVEKGKVYELVITSSNGLWRYRLGDTVRIVSTSPVKITIAGRTRSFINAFGEELMEDNAEKGIAAACERTGSAILNYTAAPVFASDGRKGHHQWLIEWETPPTDLKVFSEVLDEELRKLNSDYDAKRSHSIFLDGPEIVTAADGLFDAWLRSAGSHKLGGQRKVVRLSNDREMMEKLLKMMKKTD
ncbi:MAG: GH3 auxin-responsive promoter family protein [Muribaculaceae bacterium]|nr:GH3 auxin-responsive promoter family protein [Muribaculaceae bacterium]